MSSALAGLVILVIGDSQMMNMLNNLHSQLQDNGATVYSYAMCGSTPADWITPSVASCGTGERQDKSPAVFDLKSHPGWSINDLIARHHPQLIVVELGDTMAGYGAHLDPPASQRPHWQNRRRQDPLCMGGADLGTGRAAVSQIGRQRAGDIAIAVRLGGSL